jgi:hypothetical protein
MAPPIDHGSAILSEQKHGEISVPAATYRKNTKFVISNAQPTVFSPHVPIPVAI